MVAEVYLPILVDSHPLFDDHFDCNLHLSVQQLSEVLVGLFEHRFGIVSI